jgi:hypothetical protein
MGFAKGGADVSLEETGPNETLLKFAVKAQVGGKMAQLGARLIDATAKQMSDQFFDRFAAAVAAAEPAAPGAAPAPLPAPPVTGGGISIFELLPEAPLGIPLLAWVGSAIWLVIVALMFK